MLISYFKIAWRNLVKNKAFSIINIAGLSIGMAACFLILQYVSFQLSFDRFNKNAENIYRVTNDRFQNGKMVQHGTITYSGVSRALKDDYPEVEQYTRVEPFSNLIFGVADKKIGNQKALGVDNDFMDMFSYPCIAGDAINGLKNPNTIIITEKLARQLFEIRENDFQSIVGKAVVISRDSLPYKITAVCANIPENSHLVFDALISYVSLYSGGNNNWKEADYDFTDSDFWHYIKLKKGASYKALEAKLPAFSQKHFQGNKVSGSDEQFFLQPLTRAHLYSDFEYEIGKTGSATVVWGLLLIAVLIIVIAWVNYINLSTAKSVERAKEVGVRKVTGATRAQLMWQFLTESLIINLVALGIGILLVLLLQDRFNAMVRHELSLSYLFTRGISGYTLSIGIITLLLGGIVGAGFYPAFVLSAFKPILVLKGKYGTSGKGILLRKILVVGQFGITVILIIGFFVVSRQVRFVNSQKLGIDLSQVLVVEPPLLTSWDSNFISRENSFKAELKQLPHVQAASVIGRTVGDELSRTFGVQRSDKNQDVKYTLRNVSVDQDFLDLYHIQLLTGRNFTTLDYHANWSDLHTILINQSAVKTLGYSSINEAISKKIKFFGKEWDIVGVINDFHQKSLRYPIEPTIMIPGFGTNNPICVKVDSRDLTTTIVSIKAKYASFFPGNYFDYYFLDEKFRAQYNDDQLFGQLFGIFAGFAIFIACLGLTGLSLFATIQRTKEIGVRKVLGASVSNIVVLLSKDFVRLVIVAFAIASPLAWLMMDRWLQDFAYRIHISWWIFAITGLAAVMIALLTVSLQAVKAALDNPVRSLRTE